MKRMSQNFPNGGAMDTHFANMRSLIQVSLSESYLNEAEIVSEAESCHDAIVKGRTSTDGLLAIWYFRAGKDTYALPD